MLSDTGGGGGGGEERRRSRGGGGGGPAGLAALCATHRCKVNGRWSVKQGDRAASPPRFEEAESAVEASPPTVACSES